MENVSNKKTDTTLKDCFQIITNLLLDHIQSIGLLKILLPRQHKISLWVKYTSSLTNQK